MFNIHYYMIDERKLLFYCELSSSKMIFYNENFDVLALLFSYYMFFCSNYGVKPTSSNKYIALLSLRGRAILRVSVVSFNSTERRVESFIVSYVGYRFITACS